MTGKDILISGARELGLALEPGQIEALFVLLSELQKWNRKINLTSITTERDTVIKHVLDSLAYFKGFGPELPNRLLDMGSGAGFPAFPIKIYKPEINVTLVESVKKKASFLRHICRQLKLQGVDIVDTRLEEIPQSYQSAFDAVTARAFADMPQAMATGSRFLAQNGRLVLSRGPEETIAEDVITSTGFSLVKKLDMTLPYSDSKRAIWTFSKL